MLNTAIDDHKCGTCSNYKTIMAMKKKLNDKKQLNEMNMKQVRKFCEKESVEGNKITLNQMLLSLPMD